MASALDGLLKFCFFLSPFLINLTNPSLALGRFLLLYIYRKFSTLSGTPTYFTNLFQLAFFLILLVGLHLSFLIGTLARFFEITKVTPFESVEVLRNNLLLAPYFSLSSSMIFLLLCLLPSTALFMLTACYG